MDVKRSTRYTFQLKILPSVCRFYNEKGVFVTKIHGPRRFVESNKKAQKKIIKVR